MTTTVDTDREFWRGVLDAGGAGPIARWSLEPPGREGAHRVDVPDDLVAAVRHLAATSSVTTSAVLLAAHARVLAALTGEDGVLTGLVVAAGGPAWPCRLDTGVGGENTAAGSWRALVADAARAEADARRHSGTGIEELRGEAGDRWFETVLDPDGDRELDPDAVLRVGLAPEAGRVVLTVRHRTDALDAGAAARIAGYHLTALRALTADPDAEPARTGLVGAAELRFQIDGLAGPRRELPDLRVHELVARQVEARPDAVAAVHGQAQWTYRELAEHAERVTRALRARGLPPEGVVAVVTERNLDWAAAVLGILAAGGVYLPVEPHFPPDRIATMLRRAGCGLVLTEAGSCTSLDDALRSEPGIDRLPLADAYAEDHPDPGPAVPVGADRLAYLYFTSGSTGEPKGALCEHAGLLNHLLAKIEDLGVGPGRVVAQTAPQCFDISLWQLVSAWLVGGTTLLVEQDAILDVGRFVDTIERGRVSVLQVVPSYLDVVLSQLEGDPRELPDLACVAVTGEALKPELVHRWFRARPGTPLVNAYGLTETCDDTNHEVLHAPPAHGRVPLGRPIPGVRVYVVDPHLAPVPLGAPGEIVYSGVCVGRGYVNDPERTRRAFLADPHRPGERLYRGGDRGRWLPDGKLEFLGRRDGQVKISGFRIEVGEIENTLLRVPGVRAAAVVVTDPPSRRLVAFYVAPGPVDAELVRETLGTSLPGYMVPSELHRRANLPLTPNGKVDARALGRIAAELGDPGTDQPAPRTPTERRLASIWAALLGVDEDQIGREDDFFDRGGSSLTAVKLAVRLDRAVSLPDITRHPVLADLAALVDRTRRSR